MDSRKRCSVFGKVCTHLRVLQVTVIAVLSKVLLSVFLAFLAHTPLAIKQGSLVFGASAGVAVALLASLNPFYKCYNCCCCLLSISPDALLSSPSLFSHSVFNRAQNLATSFFSFLPVLILLLLLPSLISPFPCTPLSQHTHTHTQHSCVYIHIGYQKFVKKL